VLLFQIRSDVLRDDCSGTISATCIRSYTAPNLLGTELYSFEVVTKNLSQGKRLNHVLLATVDDWLLLFAKDHIIRLVSLQRGILRIDLQISDLQCGNYPVRGAMSPDGQYIVCGSETGELLLWSAVDGKAVQSDSIPQVQLGCPVLDAVWSEHYHLVACCALGDHMPPILVFVGGDPDYVSPPASPEKNVDRTFELPMRFVPLKDAPREEVAAMPTSLVPQAHTSTRWAAQWINAGNNPHSAISHDEKRKMKENILLEILENRAPTDSERLKSPRALPGGM